jgi:2Fe-2S ferredoxin
MPKVTYVEYNGTEHTVDVPIGTTVMRGAVDNNVPGIDADCGGECACATCHVYVDAAWLAQVGLPVPGSQEAAMLSFAAVAQPASRLSSQITTTAALRGPPERPRRAALTPRAVTGTDPAAKTYPAQATTLSFSQMPRHTHSPSRSISR